MTVTIARPRPQPDPNVGALVAELEKRIPYMVNRGSGYSNPDYRWRWACPLCVFTCENREKDVCQVEADAHKCGAAWCAIPMTPARVAALALPHYPEPTPEDRKRWAEHKRFNVIAARTSDRIVPFPGGDRART